LTHYLGFWTHLNRLWEYRGSPQKGGSLDHQVMRGPSRKLKPDICTSNSKQVTWLVSVLSYVRCLHHCEGMQYLPPILVSRLLVL
jgi:hypothetical protein